MQITEIRIEAIQALDLISIQISKSEIALTLKLLLLTLKLQEVANFGMFFQVMQTFNLIHVCVR